MNNFCPFIKDKCRENCVFHIRKTAIDDIITECRLCVAAVDLQTVIDKINRIKKND